MSEDPSPATAGGPIEYRGRRRRRPWVVLAVVVLALAAAFYYASTYFNATTPKPGPCTTVVAQPALQPADVTVNVYNATSRRGLAAATSKALAGRGFKIDKVANDPLGKAINAVAQIRYGPKGEASAKLLAQHVPGATLVKDTRTTDTVDLALGQKWKALGPAPKPAPSTNTLPPCPTSTG